jgi:hypothetical protein
VAGGDTSTKTARKHLLVALDLEDTHILDLEGALGALMLRSKAFPSRTYPHPQTTYDLDASGRRLDPGLALLLLPPPSWLKQMDTNRERSGVGRSSTRTWI